MAVIATDLLRLSHTLKAEVLPENAYCRTVAVVNDTAKTLAIGTVVGKVTATGKYKEAIQSAVDGSQVGAGVVLEAKTLTNGVDTNVLVLFRGPASVSAGGLLANASYSGATLTTLYADLEAKGIQVLTAV